MFSLCCHFLIPCHCAPASVRWHGSAAWVVVSLPSAPCDPLKDTAPSAPVDIQRHQSVNEETVLKMIYFEGTKVRCKWKPFDHVDVSKILNPHLLLMLWHRQVNEETALKHFKYLEGRKVIYSKSPVTLELFLHVFTNQRSPSILFFYRCASLSGLYAFAGFSPVLVCLLPLMHLSPVHFV